MIAECAYTVPRELVSKNAILLWRFHHTLFSVTLCLLVATEKLTARAVWRTICRSYLLTTYQSIVTIYFMNCCDWFSQIYQKRHRNILKTECNFIYWYLCSYLCSLFKIPWLKVELENHSQELRNEMSFLWDWWLEKGMKKSQIHVKDQNWEIHDCLKWLSMKQNNIWHRPTLALIGRRGLNYGKEVVNSTGVRTGEIGSSSSTLFKGEWNLTSW